MNTHEHMLYDKPFLHLCWSLQTASVVWRAWCQPCFVDMIILVMQVFWNRY